MCGFRFVVLKKTANKLHTLDSNYIARLAFYLLLYIFQVSLHISFILTYCVGGNGV
jgi:hypothetical protein